MNYEGFRGGGGMEHDKLGRVKISCHMCEFQMLRDKVSCWTWAWHGGMFCRCKFDSTEEIYDRSPHTTLFVRVMKQNQKHTYIL